ncbi:NAD(P)H-quinone oxidoreductase [Parvibaculum sp.]|jgi:NADPH:quinone reductase|uniref:NAD(P)H-quinone oxidoreductase n=1 Tax=Parvibaculum sp. TaxID=2024848 RepID=UPI000C62E58C|nr:NAD(P)H-quinone oxidoreductase [Parvibaculum sp.]MAM94725.1 NAD(P)H-quinone oxidoreductase [Parvibaculum sp.]HCX67256.1 NAD(P)H-quinone oxidoreductase [Rhodobiaceae bacterium]|tara:strand:+ start:37528 stop:38523 length:996 start_codon:yes stop_codon:yes gene_type:complete
MADLPKMMKAIAIREPGGPEVLELTEIETPRPGPDEILIRVEAAGINRPDTFQRMGLYPPPPGAPETPGLEVAGEVVAAGPGVTRWKTGDKVCALVGGGGYAEYCLAHEAHALPVPKGLSMTEAAALPETFFTVWSNVFERGALKAGETLLVHGGTSGIGTTAIQLGLNFGVTVIATAGSAEKCQAIEKLGAHAVNYREQDFVEEVKKLTEGRGADVILDMVGGDYIERNIKAAATDGRIVSIAFLNGSTAKVNFMPVMLKRLTLTGSTLRPRSIEEKAALAKTLETKVWPLLETGRIKPLIDKVFPLAQASDAHALMEKSSHIGKIVLTP